MFKIIAINFLGFSAGALVASGIFAYITMIGLLPRLVIRTHTAKYVKAFENAVIYGGTLGSIVYLFEIKVPLGLIGIILYGIGSGIFVGCLAVALAEVLNSFPIFALRIKLKKGMPYIALSLALGKLVGSLIGTVFM